MKFLYKFFAEKEEEPIRLYVFLDIFHSMKVKKSLTFVFFYLFFILRNMSFFFLLHPSVKRIKNPLWCQIFNIIVYFQELLSSYLTIRWGEKCEKMKANVKKTNTKVMVTSESNMNMHIKHYSEIISFILMNCFGISGCAKHISMSFSCKTYVSWKRVNIIFCANKLSAVVLNKVYK